MRSSQISPEKTSTSATNQRWLNTAEAAKHLGCSVYFLNRNRQLSGQAIPFARLGRCVRYDILDLDAYLEARKVGTVGREG